MKTRFQWLANFAAAPKEWRTAFMTSIHKASHRHVGLNETQIQIAGAPPDAATQ